MIINIIHQVLQDTVSQIHTRQSHITSYMLTVYSASALLTYLLIMLYFSSYLPIHDITVSN